MSILQRVNTRIARTSLIGQITQWSASGVGYLVNREEYFGVLAQVVVGQGTETSDASGNVLAQTSIVTAQGTETSDAVNNIVSPATVTSGQGSETTDATGTVPFWASVDTGQGTETSDGSFNLVNFQQLFPTGWLDNAIIIVQPGGSLWQLNPRVQGTSLAQQLILNPTAPHSEFTKESYNEYFDGMGVPFVANLFGQATTGQGTETSDASAYQTDHATVTTGQGSQSVNATGTVPFWATVATGQGSQTIDAVLSGASGAQYLSPSGWKDDVFGTGTHMTFAQTIVMVGTAYCKYGTASVANKNKTLKPSGIPPKGYGTPKIYNSRQYITGHGWQDDVFGATVAKGPQYITGKGWQDDIVSAALTVQNYNAFLYVTGIIPQIVSTGLTVTLKDRWLYLPPWDDPPEMFGAVVWQPPAQIIDCSNESANTGEQMGSLAIYNSKHNTLAPQGLSPGSFGTPTLFPHDILPAGIKAIAFGTARIENYTRYVYPKAIGPDSRFGVQWASFWIRTIYPAGWLDDIVWSQFGPLTTGGPPPGVTSGPAYISPEGFEGSGNTYDNCGYPRNPSVPRPSVHR